MSECELVLDSDHSETTNKKNVPIKKRNGGDDTLLTSDSDNEKIVFKKVKVAKENMLGEISLLTSDEEETKQPVLKRSTRAAKIKSLKKLKTIDLLTSDEDENSPVLNSKKRKLRNRDSSPITPPKKARTTVKKRVNQTDKKTVTRKKATSKITVKKDHIPTVEKLVPEQFNNETYDISECNVNLVPTWNDFELLAERNQLDANIAKNLINLLNDGNTIPFIARYRKNAIGNMTAEELRTAKDDYDEICNLKKRIVTVTNTVSKLGKLDERLRGNICNARTIEELEYIYSPFKSVGSKRTLAERAKQLGLEEPALHLLNNTNMVNPMNFTNIQIEEINTAAKVEKNIVYIIAAEMATDSELLTFLRNLRVQTRFKLQTKKARQTKAKGKEAEPKVKNKGAHKKDPQTEEMKFEIYFDFIQQVEYLKPHQILAINRGESLKILNVKIEIPEFFKKQFKWFCFNKWTKKSPYDVNRNRMLDMAMEDAYERLIVNLVSREIRVELKQKAEKESCKVFSDNLKHLLLGPPLKGKSILAIDPGYSNGCKLALISPTGFLLAHNVVYPHSNRHSERGDHVIKDLLLKYQCNIIGIGNGTACRETEEWIAYLIRTKYFEDLDVNYMIVNEEGASIYSCSPEARKEFGDLDPNIISAVSLARRIQDPMAELVKIEASHLGIGMYQLDIKKKQLEEALGEVVSECVSFVGVDLNTASQCLLRRVAGLTDSKATQIIDYREKNGAFTHRRQLLEVYGIGERIFEQCSGFLRVGPLNPSDNNFYKKKSTTPLDATIIHPESYPTVRSLLAKMNLKERDIGSDPFIKTFTENIVNYNADTLADDYKTNKENVLLIFDALSKKLNYDLRTEISKTPLFRKDITSFDELTIEMTLTGRVNNVTSFGAFVDIGVGCNGLLHNSHFKGMTVHLGDQIEVRVIKVDPIKKHIGLEAVRKL